MINKIYDKKILKMKMIYIYVIYIVFYSIKAYTMKYIINDKNFLQLPEIAKKQSENYDLIFYFEDEYYDMTNLDVYDIEFTVGSSVKFIGRKEGTIFDYKRYKKGDIKVNFSSGKELNFTIENIIFENFESVELKALQFVSKIDDFYFEINNCTFRNGYSHYISLIKEDTVKKIKENRIHAVINNCNF